MERQELHIAFLHIIRKFQWICPYKGKHGTEKTGVFAERIQSCKWKTYLFVYLFIHLFVYLFICLFIYLFICCNVICVTLPLKQELFQQSVKAIYTFLEWNIKDNKKYIKWFVYNRLYWRLCSTVILTEFIMIL